MNELHLYKILNWFKNKEYHNITSDILNELTVTNFSGTILDPRNIEYNLLYRGIKYSSKPKSYSQIIYPPKDICKIGRANLYHEQVLYCTNEKNTCLIEIDAQVGDLCVVSKWSISFKLLLNTIGFTTEVYKDLSGGYEINLPSTLEDGSSTEFIYKDDNMMKLELLGRLFTRENFNSDEAYYELTNRIRYAITNGNISNFNNRTMDGLKYPTIRNNGKSDCLALFPRVVDQGLINFEKIEFIEILEVGEFYKYKILDVANSITDEQIDWLEMKETYINSTDLDDLEILEEGGKIYCYNIFGDRLEPDSN